MRYELYLPGRRHRLRDEFSAGAVCPRWTLVDTGARVSQTGGELVFADAESGAWGDPYLELPAVARRAGLTVEFDVLTDAATGSVFVAGFSKAASALLTSMVGISASSITAKIWAESRDGEAKQLGAFALVVGTRYRGRVTVGAAGARFWLSDDGGVTWSLIWKTALGSTTPLYPLLMVNDGLHQFGHVRVYDGPASGLVADDNGADPVPSGLSILTNGDCELNANWTAVNSPTLSQQSNEQAHGGTYSWKLTTKADFGSGARSSPNFTTVIGTWYRTSGWVYLSLGAGDIRLNQWNGMDGYTDTAIAGVGGQWVKGLRCWRATAGSANGSLYFASGGAINTFYFDDVENVPLTLASCLELVCDAGRKGALVECAPTLTAKTQCGVALWVDDEADAQNGLFAYHDGTNAHLDKLVDGTWTALISAAATYGAAKALRIVPAYLGGHWYVGLYYDTGSGLVQIGTNQTVDDAGFGTKVCRFSTLAGNAAGEVIVER